MTIYLTILFGFHILGLLSTVEAVMGTRTSQGAIAWAVFLNTFPLIAVPTYWVFGRSKFQGYTEARRDSNNKLAELAGIVEKNLQPFVVSEQNQGPVETLIGMDFVSGNKVSLLIDGEVTFDSIFEGIEQAASYVLFQFYIVKDDAIGQRIQRALIEKASAGVPVYFLYDEIGSRSLPRSYLHKFKNTGVFVAPFHSGKGPNNRFQLNFRNHRKLVLVDGSKAWIGGHNIGDEYLGRNPKFGHWRDTHIRISGPAVLQAQLSFVEDWYWAKGNFPDLHWEPVTFSEPNSNVLAAPTGPADPFETCGLLFTQAINMAKERLWIASPYFIPDQAVVSALLLAGARGVDVRILIPDNPDHIGAYLAAYTYQEQAAKTGAKFYRYQNGFMHQKVLLVDDHIASVGTANFDNRSFRLNFEISAVVSDADFAKQIEIMLEADLSQSVQMSVMAFHEKSPYFQFAARLARLVAPLL